MLGTDAKKLYEGMFLIDTALAAADWDGRDGSGRVVGAGVYLARLAAGSAPTTARLVVVR